MKHHVDTDTPVVIDGVLLILDGRAAAMFCLVAERNSIERLSHNRSTGIVSLEPLVHVGATHQLSN